MSLKFPGVQITTHEEQRAMRHGPTWHDVADVACGILNRVRHALLAHPDMMEHVNRLQALIERVRAADAGEMTRGRTRRPVVVEGAPIPTVIMFDGYISKARWAHGRLDITFDVADRNGTGERIPLVFTSTISETDLALYDGEWARFVHRSIAAMLSHEADEAVIAGGERVYDPHRGEKQ